MLFRQLFEAETCTYTYLLADEQTREAVLIDPVRETVERDIQLLKDLRLTLMFVVETHVHADHVTSAGLLRERLGAKTVVGKEGGAVCADIPAVDGTRIVFGKHVLQGRSTPGHTNGCMTWVDAEHHRAFTGDAILIRGCGRTDFQQGDARKLFRSVREQIFTLPDDTMLYPAHDYRGCTVTTVAEEKALNPRLGLHSSEDAFVEVMAGLNLASPRRIHEAVPANLNCGLPEGVVRQDAVPPAEWAPVVRTDSGIPEVTADWVKGTIADGTYHLVDVRETDELASELRAIPGCEHVALATVAQKAQAWNRAGHYVVVCRSGGRSGRAALELEALGFHNVASMAGGMLAWDGPRT